MYKRIVIYWIAGLKVKIVNLSAGMAVLLKLFWDMCQFIIAMLYFV